MKPAKAFIFSKVAGLQPTTLLKTNSFTGIFQGFCQFSRESYFKEHLQMVVSAPFSNDFVVNFEHVFASLVLVFICLSHFLRKETN